MPLPALSSNILRIICDDDLQVATEENHDDDKGSGSPAVRVLPSFSDRGNSAVVANALGGDTLWRAAVVSGESVAVVPKHSPLTRRLTKHKPHIEVNLAAVSPQYQKKPEHRQHLQEVVGGSNNDGSDSDDSETARERAKITAAARREVRTE